MVGTSNQSDPEMAIDKVGCVNFRLYKGHGARLTIKVLSVSTIIDASTEVLAKRLNSYVGSKTCPFSTSGCPVQM